MNDEQIIELYWQRDESEITTETVCSVNLFT